MAVRVLLVEDDGAIGALVRTYLVRDGHHVVWVLSGEEALVELGRHAIGLVILDVALPGVDGLEVCRRVRARSSLPIIMLTARDEEPDRVAGLELGADDYVTKPFSPRELMARVKAVLRRAGPSARLAVERATPREAGDVRLDPAAREVTVGGRAVQLTAKEFDLLAHLLAHPGVVLGRDRLLVDVWGFDFPGGTRTVDVHVAQLRKKLARPLLIRTVRGAGYKLVRR